MKEINGAELVKKIGKREKLTIIDVREPFEVANEKIPGSINMPMGEISERIVELDKNEQYYLICLSGARSGHVAAFLMDLGYNVTNIIGGMSAWTGEIE